MKRENNKLESRHGRLLKRAEHVVTTIILEHVFVLKKARAGCRVGMYTFFVFCNPKQSFIILLDLHTYLHSQSLVDT